MFKALMVLIYEMMH